MVGAWSADTGRFQAARRGGCRGIWGTAGIDGLNIDPAILSDGAHAEIEVRLGRPARQSRSKCLRRCCCMHMVD